jgi:hypothetical protein
MTALSGCATTEPKIVKAMIYVPANFRMECTGPALPPNLPEKPTLDDIFAGVQNMAKTSIDQEAALSECNAKRQGLTDLIDIANKGQ